MRTGMKDKSKLIPLVLAAAMRKWSTTMVLVLLGIGTSACAIGGTRWKEEVLLHDGGRIVVERSVERGGRHEIGQRPPYKEQSLAFVMPGSKETVIWEDHYSEDIGTANFLPMLLDISNGTPYLVAYPMGCLSYNKWGRPNPPYVVFKYNGKAWQRIPLEELPAAIKTPNLIFSSPDTEVEKSGKRFMTSEMIREIAKGHKQPEYKTILREAVKGYGNSCPAMISYGKSGGWIGLDWFTQQPTLDACMKVCDREKISAENCPCNSIFKGK